MKTTLPSSRHHKINKSGMILKSVFFILLLVQCNITDPVSRGTTTEEIRPASQPSVLQTVSMDEAAGPFPAASLVIRHGEVVLEIPAGALSSPVDITIEELSRVEELNPGMKNITKGASGYRFLPDGLTFLKKVKVTVPYDRELVSSPGELSDLHTYFYNTANQYWERLERIGIDPEKGVISSYTTHFTDIINSTLTLPESPTPLHFNPTSIKDIKAADPGSGINLLEPPQANNQGSASL
ncbi:MAG TPA: hypothetical protein ENN69_07790, partial [Spirochaetia bacterium]|nr:hypothetical protein [Spirochaetia bacterium]